MPRSVAYRSSAAAEFHQLPKAVQRELRDQIGRVARYFPTLPPGLDVEPIRGTETLWRLAIREYRCVFRMEGDRLVVFAIGSRHGFYGRFG